MKLNMKKVSARFQEGGANTQQEKEATKKGLTRNQKVALGVGAGVIAAGVVAGVVIKKHNKKAKEEVPAPEEPAKEETTK